MQRLALLALLLAAPPPAVTAQACGSLLYAAQRLDNAPSADPHARLDAARRARVCVLRSRAQGLAATYVFEARALADLGRWDDLAALADSIPPTTARNGPARRMVLRLVGLARVHAGQPTDGLAALQALLADPSLRAVPGERAETYLTLARAHRVVGDLSAAARDDSAALVAARSMPPDAARNVAVQALAEAALAHLDQHDATGSASALRRADAALRPARAQATSAEGRALVALPLARLHLARGRLDSAAALLAGLPPSDASDLVRVEVAVRRKRWGVAEALLARLLRRSPGASQRRAEVLTWRGRVAERTGRLGEAERAFSEVLSVHAALHSRGRDPLWLAWQARERAALHGRVRVLVAQGRTAEAFALHDGYRARLLRQRQGEARRAPAAASRYAALVARLAAAREAARLAPDPAQQALFEARARTLDAYLTRTADAVDARPTDVSALQARLRRDGRSVLAFALAPALDDAPSASLAFLVTPDTVVAHRLAVSGDSLRRLVTAVGPALSGSGAAASAASLHAFDLSALHALYRVLVAPVRPWITSRVTVVPDGVLHGLPFGALPVRPVGRFDYGRARFFAEEAVLSTALAASLPPPPAPQPASPPTTLVLARTRYAPPLPDLPSVRDEAAFLRRSLPGVRVLADDEATEDTFRVLAPAARIVHVAAHTEQIEGFPLHDAFRLSPTPRSDGRLTVYDLQRIPLSAEIVALSGCSSARGEEHPGEGLWGLQYAVHAAGAPSVLATHWVVDDRASADLYASFYRRALEGAPLDSALTEAQRTWLASHAGPERSPFFWAAIGLSGETRGLSVRAAARRVRFGGIVVLAVALATAGAIVLRRRLRPRLSDV